MRRSIAVLVSLMFLAAAAPGVVLAEKPDRGCPAAASHFLHVDRDGWWAETVAGFGEAGIPVYEADGVTFTAAFDAWAQSFGLADGAAVEEFVRGEQWDRIDKNDNDWVCMRNQPNTPGSPAYIFVGIDDTSNARN